VNHYENISLEFCFEKNFSTIRKMASIGEKVWFLLQTSVAFYKLAELFKNNYLDVDLS